MLYDVVLLRKNGERLPKNKRPPFLRGTIQIAEMDRQHNNFKRNVVQIHLWQAQGDMRKRGLANMFDPVLLPYEGPAFVIAGTELEVSGEAIIEHRQVWLCVPAAGSEEEWERAEAARERAERKQHG